MPAINRPLPGSIPGHCVQIPGRQSDPDGFYQFPTHLDGIQGTITLEISAAGARRMAQLFPGAGLVFVEDYEAAQKELEDACADADKLRERIAELEAFKANIAGLEAHGFRVAKKKGPQVKPQEVAV